MFFSLPKHKGAASPAKEGNGGVDTLVTWHTRNNDVECHRYGGHTRLSSYLYGEDDARPQVVQYPVYEYTDFHSETVRLEETRLRIPIQPPSPPPTIEDEFRSPSPEPSRSPTPPVVKTPTPVEEVPSPELRWADECPTAAKPGTTLFVESRYAPISDIQWLCGNAIVAVGKESYTVSYEDVGKGVRATLGPLKTSVISVADDISITFNSVPKAGSNVTVLPSERGHPLFPAGLRWSVRDSQHAPWALLDNNGNDTFAVPLERKWIDRYLQVELMDAKGVPLADTASVVIGTFPPNISSVEVSGSPVQGATLCCRNEVVAHDGPYTCEVVWKSDTLVVGKGREYICKSEDVGHIIHCEITAIASTGMRSDPFSVACEGAVRPSMRSLSLGLPEENCLTHCYVGTALRSPLDVHKSEYFNFIHTWHKSPDGLNYVQVGQAGVGAEWKETAKARAQYEVGTGAILSTTPATFFFPTADDLNFRVIAVSCNSVDEDGLITAEEHILDLSTNPRDCMVGSKRIASVPVTVTLHPEMRARAAQQLSSARFVWDFVLAAASVLHDGMRQGVHCQLKLDPKYIIITTGALAVARVKWSAQVGAKLMDDSPDLIYFQLGEGYQQGVLAAVSPSQRDELAVLFRSFHGMGMEQVAVPLVGKVQYKSWVAAKGAVQLSLRGPDSHNKYNDPHFDTNIVLQRHRGEVWRIEAKIRITRYGLFWWQAYTTLLYLLLPEAPSSAHANPEGSIV